MAEKYPSKRAYTHPKLKKFLVEKGVYKQFIHNCKNDKYIQKTKRRFFKDIMSAFTWNNCKEGHSFWYKLERERYEQT